MQTNAERNGVAVSGKLNQSRVEDKPAVCENLLIPHEPWSKLLPRGFYIEVIWQRIKSTGFVTGLGGHFAT